MFIILALRKLRQKYLQVQGQPDLHSKSMKKQKTFSIESNVLYQQAWKLYETFSKGSPEMSGRKPFSVNKGWSYRLRNRFRLQHLKITGETTSANEKAPRIFLAELQKLKRNGTMQSKSSTVMKLISSGRRCTVESIFRKVQRRHQGVQLGGMD
jgi:hypothetical protein